MKTNSLLTAQIKTIKYSLGHFQTRATPSEFIGLNPNADVTFCDGPTILGVNLPDQFADQCADFLNALIACRNMGVDAAETESDVTMPACDNNLFAVALAGAANAVIAAAIARFALIQDAKTTMKTLKLKHSLASGGNLMPQQDGAKPGYRNGCMTIAVTGLPDNATHADAKRVAQNAMMPSWLDNIDASQAGKNLYRAENLTETQLATAPDWYREKYCQPS